MDAFRDKSYDEQEQPTVSALQVLERVAGCDVARLSPLQRILLITDGTLTEILEAHFLEPVELVKLSQRTFVTDAAIGPSFADSGERILERRINLRGARSGCKYVYAESLVRIERLPPAFRSALMESDIPLGRLWHEFRLETYKELLGGSAPAAGDLGAFLDCAPASGFLARTYDVISAGNRLMRIAEYFRADGVPGSN